MNNYFLIIQKRKINNNQKGGEDVDSWDNDDERVNWGTNAWFNFANTGSKKNKADVLKKINLLTKELHYYVELIKKVIGKSPRPWERGKIVVNDKKIRIFTDNRDEILRLINELQELKKKINKIVITIFLLLENNNIGEQIKELIIKKVIDNHNIINNNDIKKLEDFLQKIPSLDKPECDYCGAKNISYDWVIEGLKEDPSGSGIYTADKFKLICFTCGH